MRNDPSLPSGASLRGCVEESEKAYRYELLQKIGKEMNEDA